MQQIYTERILLNSNEMKTKTKTKTLEDALFDTGAPDEIILLAMVEMDLQNKNYLNDPYYYRPFAGMLNWDLSQQDYSFWSAIDELYQIR